MLGIGHHLDKQTKIKLLAQKSKQYNTRAHQLESQQVQPQHIPEILAKEDYNRRHFDDEGQNSKKVQGLGGSITMAFDGTHKVQSSTQEMFKPVETNFKKTQQLKSQGKFTVNKCTPSYYSESLKQQKDINDKMKHRIYQDHLQQMWDGMNQKDKMVSQNKKNYVHDKNYQNELDRTNKEHFQKKNDIKWYSEQYVKTKLSLRK